MDCSPPGSSAHGILQARRLECVTISFSRGSFQPRNWTRVSCIAGRFFTSWATREALHVVWCSANIWLLLVWIQNSQANQNTEFLGNCVLKENLYHVQVPPMGLYFPVALWVEIRHSFLSGLNTYRGTANGQFGLSKTPLLSRIENYNLKFTKFFTCFYVHKIAALFPVCLDSLN